MNLDFLTYFQWIFLVILGLAILMGFLRGMKKTLFTLITMAIFYVIFFVTVIPVSKLLWTMDMPWLGGLLGNIDASLADFTSFEASIIDIMQFALGDSIDLSNPSAELMDLVVGIGQFALKIIYTVLYFTIILLVYKLICWILGMIILGKSEKGESKNRGFGALIGVGNGVMAIFITLIMLGGIMSVSESMLSLLPQTEDDSTTLSFDGRGSVFEASNPIIALEEVSPFEDPEMAATIEDLRAMVDAYNNNFVVKLADSIQTASLSNPDQQVALHINLFDRVLSFEYNEEVVALRYELSVLASVGAIFMNSDFATTQEISDLTGSEIRQMFAGLGQSNLIVSMMPLAIELAADYFDQPLPIDKTELYAIDFAAELPVVGEIAGSLFDILNGADVISGGGDVQDIVIDGDFARDLFGDMADSEVVVLLVEALVVPMLEDEESDIGNIIKIPADLVWEEELDAIGLVIGDLLDNDLTFADISSGDSSALLNAAASVDIDIILGSGLITETLINILRGDSGIEGFDFLTVPSGLTWLGDDLEGELRNILEALQVLLEVTDGLDTESIGLDTITKLTDAEIDILFDSEVIVATVSDIIMSQDLGDTAIVVPDEVLTLQDYINKDEMKALAKAIKMIIDESLTETDFDVTQALSMTEAEVDKFTASKIISATVGKLVIDLEVDMLVIPDEIIDTIEVDGVDTDVIDTEEIKALLLALAILELDDFETMNFDASIIDKFSDVTAPTTLDDDLINTFLDSKIIHASASSMLFDLDDVDSSVLFIPTLAVDGTAVVSTIGTTQYIATTEIGALFKALKAINIVDFNTIDLEDTETLIDNMSIFLESAILHATISDQILSIDSQVLTVPYQDGSDVPIDIIISQAETDYIITSEIEAFVNAVQGLGFDDPTAIDTEFTLTALDEESEQNELLDSAIIHATISDKMIGFGASVLVIPDTEYDGVTAVRYETGPMSHKTEYLTKAEIKAIIEALEILGIDSIDNFSGTLGLGSLFASQDPEAATNQDTLLASASLHATISDQLLGLSDAVLIVPDTDILDQPIQKLVGTVQYLDPTEIKAIINGIDVLTGGLLDSVENLSGVFTLDNLSTLASQDTLLASASLHATISQRLFDVDPSILSVPDEDQNSAAIIFSAGLVGQEIDYVESDEIKAIINALNAMDYPDLDSFTTEFDLGEIVDNANTILLSATIQSMFSDRLMNDTGTALVVPNEYYGTVNDIRITTTGSGDFYIDYTELVNLITALDSLGLTTISNTWDFGASSVLGLTDFSTILASEIVQATISANILPAAKDETESPTAQDLVVPNFFRQTINVGIATDTQIEKAELEDLLNSLKLLGITAFGDNMDADQITTIFNDPISRATFLASGSIHVTIDNMIKQNPDVGSSVPVLAQYASIYNIANVTKETEITAFILAADALATAMASEDSFIEISFTFAGLLALDGPAQSTVLDSMIVRNKITPETEIFCAVQLPPYTLEATDYEDNNTAYFLRKATFEDIIVTYS